MHILASLLFLLLLMGASSANAETPASDDVEQLIAALVSPNKEPECEESTDDLPRYPIDYDHAGQERVIKARDTLLSRGKNAFPKVMKHIEDTRYSFNEEIEPHFCINFDVGHVCYRIFLVQLEVYDPLMIYQNPTDPNRFWVPREPRNLEKWWKERENLSLREIQLEGAKWAYARQKQTNFLKEKTAAKVLGDLQRLIERLESSDKPIQVDFKGNFLNEPELKRTRS